jgi:hypothetical protein
VPDDQLLERTRVALQVTPNQTLVGFLAAHDPDATARGVR